MVADDLESFTSRHVCIYAQQCDIPSKVIDLLRENCVTGKLILTGMLHAHACRLELTSIGITEDDLMEAGVRTRIARSQVMHAFNELIRTRGLLARAKRLVYVCDLTGGFRKELAFS